MDTARAAALLFCLTFPLGCSLAVPTTEDAEPAAAASAGTGLTPAMPAVATVPAVTPPPCPASAPGDGDACATEDLLCSWGDDVRFGCRTVTRCSGGAWRSVGSVCTQPEPSCPQAPPPAPEAGISVCTDAQLGITCAYDQEAYTCAPCNGTYCRAENHWQAGTLSASCPATAPNFGEPCASPSAACDYNGCAQDGNQSLGASMTCVSGYWTAVTSFVCL